uniref:Apple domain-containing protein n=1 Tax=Rhabditophanes sp. KR3021 TaxID=114890 RepID=A0AC35U5N3_9BILA
MLFNVEVGMIHAEFIRIRVNLNTVESKCFSVPNNLTIAGADYRQSVGIPLLTCARGCFDDVCCMAYEWTYENSGTCTHKSRSLNGTLVHKSNAVFGICLDEDDEERENLADHVIEGRLTALPTHTMRIDCEDYCAKFDDTTMYSWHGDNYHGGPETNGDCFCLGVLQGILLQFGSSAGFIINK